MGTFRPFKFTGLFLQQVVLGSLFAAVLHADNQRIYRFTEPLSVAYRVSLPADPEGNQAWVEAIQDNGSHAKIELNKRIVLQLKDPDDLEGILGRTPLKLWRTVTPNTFILEAKNVWSALQWAQTMAARSGVISCQPVIRQPLRLRRRYAPKPSDTFFLRQWYLENRNPNTGASFGLDLDVRSAWPVATGKGVSIAVVDSGVELNHPDLQSQAINGFHKNFITSSTNGFPTISHQGGATEEWHGTAVAGLALATGYDHRGMLGVAPDAGLASWVIFDANNHVADSVELMDMFQYRTNKVAIQNHSWGSSLPELTPVPLLERIAISNAVTFGRNGKGVIMVRAGGNNRDAENPALSTERAIALGFHPGGGDANDDGYAADPLEIAVAAIRKDGRAASYSSPGACLLVAAPGGEDQTDSLFTTDRQGQLGLNKKILPDNLADYNFGDTGFIGTSASTPLISGIAALILSANPNLGYRDVQQILINSARHYDLEDPDLVINGAGYRVSHNVGFGIPDAGIAVRLARIWKNRPPLKILRRTINKGFDIPDEGVRVVVTGSNVPEDLQSIPATPSMGIHPDTPTASLPTKPLGLVANPIRQDLTGHGALIQRGDILFRDKINFAAEAGAAFAIIYNNAGENGRVRMGGTDFVKIPAVSISRAAGEALSDFLKTSDDAKVQLEQDSVVYAFEIEATMICEHVGVTASFNHPRRGDLRLTLESPQGTRSILQRENLDPSQAPARWMYYSTHHFYESSAGTWRVRVTDVDTFNQGATLVMGLSLYGTEITDTDRDGLDDGWEEAHFGTLKYGPQDDPDHDGYQNAKEQASGTDPARSDLDFKLDLSPWNANLLRISWPSLLGQTYQVFSRKSLLGPRNLLDQVTGKDFESEWFVPLKRQGQQLFEVVRVAN